MVAKALDRPGLLDEHIDDAHITAIFADLNRDTWFYLHGCGDVAATSRGTGPGGPLADILFAISPTLILDDIESRLRDMGALLCLPPPNGAVFSRPSKAAVPAYPADSTLADDVVLFTGLPQSAMPEVAKVFLQQVVRNTDAAVRSRGFTLNYDDGKSGFTVSPTGKYARRVKQLFYLHCTGRLPVPGAVGSIKIESAYKHLGTVATCRLTMDVEIAARTACARTAMAPLRKAALRLAGLSVKHKLSLTDACATSILFFHCGAWPPLSGTQGARVQGAYAQLLAAATGLGQRSAKEHSSHAEISVRANRVDARTFVRLARLRMLHRVVATGSVRRMIHPSDRARGSIACCPFRAPGAVPSPKTSLGRRRRSGGTCRPRPPPSTTQCSWPPTVRRGPPFAGVRAGATWRHIDQCKPAVWQKTLPLHHAPAPLEPPEDGPGRLAAGIRVDGQATAFYCYECGDTFDSGGLYKVRKRRAHGVRRPARRYAEGGTCRACGVSVHTRPRLIQHLNHGLGGCLAKYIAFAAPIPEQCIQELEAVDRERRKALAAAGLRETHAETPAFANAARPCWPDPPGPEAIAEATLVRPAAMATERVDAQCPLPAPVLTPGVPLLVLHLFSGQRRELDFQYFMEAEAVRHGLPLLVLSLDVVNDPYLGDLTRPEAQVFLHSTSSGGAGRSHHGRAAVRAQPVTTPANPATRALCGAWSTCGALPDSHPGRRVRSHSATTSCASPSCSCIPL